MNKFLMLTILILLIGITNAVAQKRANKSPKRKLRLITKPIPEPKIETEDWNQFQSVELKFKMVFPKEPTKTVNEIDDGLTKAKSTVYQSYINQIYYMVEVRKYPKNFLPDRDDWSLTYGEWMKEYVLEGVNVHNERVFDFGGNLAVEFVYQQTKNDLLIHRACVVGQNLYQQIIQLEIKKNDNLEQTIEKNKEKINRFLDSFHIIENQINDSSVG